MSSRLAALAIASAIFGWTLTDLAGAGGTKPSPANTAAQSTNIDYGEPTNAVQRAIRDKYRARGLLESFAGLFQRFHLPKPIGFRLAACDGEVNAWYEPEDGMITVCYEYIQELEKNAPKTITRDGVTPDDAVAGPLIEVFLHEAGHAIFERLSLPILGREEDAADQFAAFLMLQLGDDIALRSIRGTALMYAKEAKNDMPGLESFADEHAVPAQRLFNLMCMAYGSNPKLFRMVVDKGYLPKERAEGCPDEYAQVGYALVTLLSPYVEKKALAEFFKAGKISWSPKGKR